MKSKKLKSKEVIAYTAYFTRFRCSCGRVKDYYHGGDGKPKKSDYPTCGEHDGWLIGDKVKCVMCRMNDEEFGKVISVRNGVTTIAPLKKDRKS